MASNQLDWSALYDMYAEAEKNQREANLARQGETDAANKAFIDQAFKDMEREVYDKVERGEQMDFSQTKPFNDLMKRFTQDNTQVQGMPWERLLTNPNQSEREGTKDPWSQIMERLSNAQENANFQADFKKEQAEWRKYQEDLAAWNKQNQKAYGEYIDQLDKTQNATAYAAQGINRTAQERGGIGQSWFFSPEGKAYLEQQAKLNETGGGTAPVFTPVGNKPTYTGNYGTSGSVAGKRNKNEEDPLF